MRRTRVLIVDDDASFRNGLRLLIESEECEVVGEAADGREALRHLNVAPDVVLMDLRMSGMDGIEATQQMLMRPNPPAVIAITTFDDDKLLFDALRAGAVSYVLKDTPPDELRAAIRSAHEGQSLMTPSVARKVVDEFARLARLGRVPAEATLSGLSKRELEVLRFLSQGASSKEIASRLVLEDGTVRNHLSSIYRKMGVTDRVQAVIRARELGVV